MIRQNIYSKSKTLFGLSIAVLLSACGDGSNNSGKELASRNASDVHSERIGVVRAQATSTKLTPTAATASGSERADLAPAFAIDGNNATRWSSGFTDDQFLQIDFGKIVSIDHVIISWEQAHAVKYLLETSNDGVNWSTIKTVDNSQGGTEDWTGLTGQGRYLRIQGITRSTQYGYSILEIQAFGESVDAPSSPTPPSSVSYTPLFPAGTPVMEQIQYTEPDGTLVTVAGFRPTESRHYRESNAHGFLSFPALYFQNRNFGLIIRDGVPAGRQEIKIYARTPQGKTLDGQDVINIQQDWGISVFRNQSFGGKYGWNDNNGLMKNKLDKYANYVFDPTRPYTNGQICASDNGQFDCERPAITAYEDNDVYWDGTKGEGRRALKIGDGIEISAANFLPPGAGHPATIDGGGPRYYSWEQLYVVGKGIVPWYGGKPALYSVPIPDDALSGGTAGLNYQYAGQPHRIFQQVVNNIGYEDVQRFTDGRRIFHTSFSDGKHTEFPDINPPISRYVNQVGSHFNAERCISCHTLNGRSMPVALGQAMNAFSVLTGVVTETSVTPDPKYGMNVQQLPKVAGDDRSVVVDSYVTSSYVLPDGERVELQKPVYSFKGGEPVKYSVRQAPQIIGAGLLEAIDETTILQIADDQAKNGNGVHGVPNWAVDPETGQKHLGRFGWKAGKGSLRHQASSALMLDMGVLSPVYPSRACQQNVASADCKNTHLTGGITEADLQKLTHYLELLGVPSQVSYKSSFRPSSDNSIDMPMTTEHDIDPAAIKRGATLFASAQCIACHKPQVKTGNNHLFAELRNQVIHPYSDLLLHDMGPGLADTLPEGAAKPSMWRTQPLWGIGSLAWVQIDEKTAAAEDKYEDRYTPRPKKGDVTNARYLHDGRARTIKEAILWHDGEAAASRKSFENLSKSQREDLITFLKSL